MARSSRPSPGLNMVAGHIAKMGPPAKVQGGTRTVIAPKGGKISSTEKGDSGIQGGTNMNRSGAGDKGGNSLFVAPRSVRNSHFAPGTGSRGTSKAKGGSSAASTAGRD